MSPWHNDSATDDQATSVSVQSLLDQRYYLREHTLLHPVGAGQWTGNFRGVRRGQGLDFDDLRHYSPGDEIRHIDWNASARTNVLHTRLFREEREYSVTVVADLRRIQFTGTQTLRAVKICQLSARLLWQAVEGGARIRLVVLRDTGIHAGEHGSGHRAAISACALLAQCCQSPSDALEGLIELASNTNNESDPHSRYNATLAYLAYWLLTQRPLHGSLIWISAFDQVGEQFDKNLLALSQAIHQAAVYVHDEMVETGLPVGRYGYRTGRAEARSTRTISLDKTQVKRLRAQLKQQAIDRQQRFRALRIPLLNTQSGLSQIVMTLRQRALLP